MFPLRGLCGHPFDRTGNKFVSHAINYIQPRPLARTRVTRANNGTLSLCPPRCRLYLFVFSDSLSSSLSLSARLFSYASFRFGRYCPHKYLRNKFFNLVALIAQMTLPFIRTHSHGRM